MPESVFTQTMPALFAGGAWWAAAVFEADALAGAAGGGVGESSAVALLSVASAFFGVVIFFEDAVPESGAACELEAPASALFFFVFLVAVELV